MSRRLLIALLLSLPLAASGQYLPLWHSAQGARLDFNYDRLWSYNLYEQSRWGAGLRYTLPPCKADGTRVWMDGYVGYGVLDRQWKGGIGATVRHGHSRYGLVQHVRASRDYEAAGSRNLATATLANPMSLAGFMSRRMSDRVSVTWGYLWRVHGRVHRLEGSMGIGGRLFDNEPLLYRAVGDSIAKEDCFMLRWLMQLPQGISTQIEVGSMMPQHRHLARLLAQYDHTFLFTHTCLQTFAQTGVTAPHTPYTYMFDLGGTWGAPLNFHNSLLTARPNEFTANTFLFLSLRYALREPLVEGWNRTLQIGTAPRPFVGLNGAWGHLYGQNPDGYLQHEGLDLQAPLWGIVEPQAGIEGVLRWGIADWGVAVAYRLVPTSAPYRLASTRENLALLITATLIL